MRLVRRPVARDPRELLSRAVHGERRGRLETYRAKGAVGEARLFGFVEEIEHRDQIGLLGRRVPPPARPAEVPARARANVALGDERRQDRPVLGDPARFGLDQTRARRGWRGKASIRSPDRGERAVASNAPRRTRSSSSAARRAGSGGASSHVELAHVARAELQPRLRQVEPADLGRVVLVARVVIGLRVEAEAPPGARPPARPVALRRRRAADLLDPATREPRPRLMLRDAREPAVDDRDDAVDRDRRLGHVRRQDRASAASAWPYGAILLRGREVPVERDEEQIALPARLPRTPPARSGSRPRPGGTRARPRRAPRSQAPHRRGDLLAEVPVVGRGEVLERHVEPSPLGAQRRRAQVARRLARAVERRGHHDDARGRAARRAAGAARGTRARRRRARCRSWNSSSTTDRTPRSSGSRKGAA